jgi:tripartite-type tricarboxylate transporter receptor subunit TctC
VRIVVGFAAIMVMPIGPMAVVPHVCSDITYDPVKDFTAVALGSTFQFAIADLTELHRAGRIRILASSGAARSTAVPEVPTFNELGLKGVEATGWFGFFAPAKTPKPIVDLLNRGINKALQAPDVVEKLSKLGMDPMTGTPEEFARIVAAGYAKWGPIVKASGFKPE